MQIFLSKNGAQFGPFSEDEVRGKLATGEFGLADLAWHDGMPTWLPVSQVLGLPPPMQPTPPTAFSPGYPAPYPAQAWSPPNWLGAAEFHYAGFWRRFVAWLVDGTLLSLPFYLFFGAPIFTYQSYHYGSHASVFTNSLGGGHFWSALVMRWLYYALLESSPLQATLGKLLMGIKVVNNAGLRIGFGRATGRFFAKIISVIAVVGYVMAGFTARKQALHDMIADTLVIVK